MDLSPEFSSQTEERTVALAELQELATSPLAIQLLQEAMTVSTQDTESEELVTKKVEETPDPWEDKPSVVEHTGKPDRDGVVVTSKAGAGFEVPWIVLHATDVADAIAQLNSDEYTELMDLTARKAKEFAKAFGGSQSFAKPAAQASSGGWSKPAQQAASAPAGNIPSGTCPVHNCDLVKVDAFTKRDGTSVNARVGCPVPKCYSATTWQNDDGSWGKK